ncbi:hypothetical protein ACHAXM_006458 [Skeletonema potamos]|jgi:hypothetical protein
MNTRRLPTRASAKQKSETVNNTEEKGGVPMDGASERPAAEGAPAKRQRRINEKNDVDTTDVKQKDGTKPAAIPASSRTPKTAGRNPSQTEDRATNNKETTVRKVLKNDDDQTATTCTETPATEEKTGASIKEPVSRADFYHMNRSSGAIPPDSFKNGIPPLKNAAFRYPSYPAPPLLPYYGPPGIVPPTVHMPFPVSQISPLQIQQSLKKNCAKEPTKNDPPSSNPVTPRQASVKESEAALAMLGCATEGSAVNNSKSSPLDLLSSVSSSSPTAKEKKSALEATLPPFEEGAVVPPFKYPPPPEQMDVNNFHCFPQVPQSGLKFDQADEYPLPPISTTFGLDDDFNPDTPSSRHSSIGDVLNAANMVERTESTIKSTRKRYAAQFSDMSSKRRKSPETTEGSDLFSARSFPPGTGSTANPPSVGGSTMKSAHSVAPEIANAAEKACTLAQQALENPYIGKQLLLSMAIVRTNPRSPPSSYPAHGTLLTDRFHWAQFPPLDTILRKSMKQYYELSTQKCQSKDQQDFNNALVDQVKNEATKYGWEFDRKSFDDKKIRDRIRCFFKTHIQNAKKRLKTMLRNPSKKANIKALADHFHLIEEKNKIKPPIMKEEGCAGGSEVDEREIVDTLGSNDESAGFLLEESSDKAQLAAYSEV